MGLSERKIWVDGELVPWEGVTVHVLSQSLQRGSLVFDVMPSYRRGDRTLVFGLREHVERFLRSARLNGMQLERDCDELVQAIRRTLRANPGAEIVKISAYHAGLSLDVLPPSRKPTVAIAAFAIADLVPGYPGRGVLPPARLQIAAPIKMPARVFSPQVKIAAGYTHAAMAKQRARDEGFDDVLFLDEDGRVAESSTQSFFLVERGVVRTSHTATVLEGITRRAAIELIEDEGIPFKEEPLEVEALEHCSEAFMTGTSINIWPVARIGERALPTPVPGPVTARLMARFERLLALEDPELSPRWMQEA